MRYIKCGLNDLKLVYFSNFGFFLPSPRLIFPFILVKVLNYWASFSLFWVGFLNQYLLGLSNYFLFLGKTRVIKLLIIYLILKLIKYIDVKKGAVQCGFLIIKPQTTLHLAVWCGAVQYYLRCDAVMPFCGRFWCGLCGLCSLVNTSRSYCTISINFYFYLRYF